jgi:hypothetical protein
VTLYRWLVSFLVWLSADPRAVELEHPKAAAAVSAARASMLVDTAPPAPGPAPVACDCGQTCRNGVWKPDGRVEQICRCNCDRCKRSRAAGRVPDCPDGKCRL